MTDAFLLTGPRSLLLTFLLFVLVTFTFYFLHVFAFEMILSLFVFVHAGPRRDEIKGVGLSPQSKKYKK